MIIVKGAKNRDGQRAEDWMEYAKGEIDEFGNPFEIIELRWNATRLHPNNEYAKTRGFDDAVIEALANGRIKIGYRQKTGSVMWIRPLGGRGAFIGKLPRTPRNMRMLASHYRDGLWKIRDPHIEVEVMAMSEKLWESMDEETKAFNEERIRAMHTLATERSLKAPIKEYEIKREKDDLAEERRLLAIERQKLARREAVLNEKEKGMVQAKAQLIKEGVPDQQYTEPMLMSMGMAELRKIARTVFDVKFDPTWNKQTLIDVMLKKPKEEPQESVAD